MSEQGRVRLKKLADCFYIYFFANIFFKGIWISGYKVSVCTVYKIICKSQCRSQSCSWNVWFLGFYRVGFSWLSQVWNFIVAIDMLEDCIYSTTARQFSFRAVRADSVTLIARTMSMVSVNLLSTQETYFGVKWG